MNAVSPASSAVAWLTVKEMPPRFAVCAPRLTLSRVITTVFPPSSPE